MTDWPQYKYELVLDTNAKAPTLVVGDVTNPDAVVTYAQSLPKGGAPYALVIASAADAPKTLAITPAADLTKYAHSPSNGGASNASVIAPAADAPKALTITPAHDLTQQAIARAVKAGVKPSPKSTAPVSNGSQHWFELTLDTNPDAPTLTVSDDTDPQAVTTSAMPLPQGGPPYVLLVSPVTPTSDTLRITPQAPGGAFNPNVTTGRSVLQFSASMADQRLTTWDDSRYVVNLKNVSEYYIAEDIRVRLALISAPRLPDGNEGLEIIPNEQHVRCIDPGAEHELTFVVIARGIRPGQYPVRLQLAYRIVYWDGRETSTTYSQMLSVHE